MNMSQTVIVESWVVPRRLSQSLTVNYTLEWRWIEGERKHELLRHAGRKNLLHLWKFQVRFYGKALHYIFSSFENIHPSIHASIYPSIFFRLSEIGLRWQQAKQDILDLFSSATLSSSFWGALRWSFYRFYLWPYPFGHYKELKPKAECQNTDHFWTFPLWISTTEGFVYCWVTPWEVHPRRSGLSVGVRQSVIQKTMMKDTSRCWNRETGVPFWSLVWEGSSPAKPKEMTFSHLTVGPPHERRDIGARCVVSHLAGNSKKLWLLAALRRQQLTRFPLSVWEASWLFLVCTEN